MTSPQKASKDHWLIKGIQSDGYDYAIRFGYSKTLYRELTTFGSSFFGNRKQWIRQTPTRVGGPLAGHWHFISEVLDRRLDEFYELLERVSEAEGQPLGFTEDQLQRGLVRARIEKQPNLFASGLRIELRQLEDMGTAVSTNVYSRAVKELVLAHKNVGLSSELNVWVLPYLSAATYRQRIEDDPRFEGANISVVPGVYRINEEESELEELTEAERKDFERVLARRGGMFSELEIIEEVALREASGDLDVDDEGSASIKRFLEITDRIKHLDYDETELQSYLSEVEGNIRAYRAASDSPFDEFMPTQHEGIRFLVKRNSSLLADDMGMGKTLTAIAAAGFRRRQTGKKVVVVTNKSALDRTWRESVIACFPHDGISMVTWDDAADWVLINYERLYEIEAHADEVEVIIFDEAHKVCVPVAMRTSRAFNISKKIPHRYLVTGTPLLNTNVDVHTLLRLSGHPLGDFPAIEFVTLLETNKDFRDIAFGILRKEWLIRRMKTSLGLKPKARVFKSVKMNAEQNKQFKQLLVRKPGRGAALAQMTSMRIFLASVKLHHLAQTVDKLKPRDKMIIFCEHIQFVEDAVRMLEMRGHRAVMIHGGSSDAQRTKAQMEFEGDPEVRFFVGTTKSAGESITLVAANKVYFLTLPWTAAAQVQAEDRAYRKGQKRKVEVIVPLVEKTIDGRCWDIICEKAEMAEDLFTAKVEDEKKNIEQLLHLMSNMAA